MNGNPVGEARQSARTFRLPHPAPSGAAWRSAGASRLVAVRERRPPTWIPCRSERERLEQTRRRPVRPGQPHRQTQSDDLLRCRRCRGRHRPAAPASMRRGPRGGALCPPAEGPSTTKTVGGASRVGGQPGREVDRGDDRGSSAARAAIRTTQRLTNRKPSRLNATVPRSSSERASCTLVDKVTSSCRARARSNAGISADSGPDEHVVDTGEERAIHRRGQRQVDLLEVLMPTRPGCPLLASQTSTKFARTVSSTRREDDATVCRGTGRYIASASRPPGT